MKLNSIMVDQVGDEGTVEVTTTDKDGNTAKYRYQGRISTGMTVNGSYFNIQVTVDGAPRKRDNPERNIPSGRFAS